MNYWTVAAAIRATGLAPRGGFAIEPCHRVPALAAGRPARTLVLAGNVGPAMWTAFARSPEAALPENPLDRWTRRVLTAIARELGAEPLFPFGGPPHLPFQRWAQEAEAVFPSPLGLLIHAEHGLWHAYRGALAFAEAFPAPPRPAAASPCETCAGRPCLSACPVSAFTATGYNVGACAQHIAAPRGADCRSHGCLARRACPIGREHAYAPDQQAFHMRAFLEARGLVPDSA